MDDCETSNIRPRGRTGCVPTARWRNALTFISQVVLGEPVGSCEIDDEGNWQAYDRPVELAIIAAAEKLAPRKPGTRPRPPG
jgi:hypothetical protein